jgi:hypothetical protein
LVQAMKLALPFYKSPYVHIAIPVWGYSLCSFGILYPFGTVNICFALKYTLKGIKFSNEEKYNTYRV